MFRQLRKALRGRGWKSTRRPDRRGRPILFEMEDRKLLATTQADAYITGLYRGYLLRTPSTAETDFWVGVLDRRGAGFVSSSILGSAERTQLVADLGVDIKGQATPFVSSLYTGILERQPDARGEAFWLRQVGRGEDRQAIVQAFLSSPEYARNRTTPTRTLGGLQATTSVYASPNPGSTAAPLTLTATVAPNSSGINPTGSVNFYNGSTYVTFASLIPDPNDPNSMGTAITNLPVGSNAITAVYSGDGNFAPNTSPVLTVRVNGGR